MKLFAFFFSAIFLGVSASDLVAQKQRKLDQPGLSIDISVFIDRFCEGLTNIVDPLSQCNCGASPFNVLDGRAILEVTASCDISLPFDLAFRTVVVSTDIDTFQLTFQLINDGDLPIPMLEYSFPARDLIDFIRRDLETEEQTSVAKKGPATPSCTASYGGKHCLCSVCETSEGEKGYNTYCGELPDHIPASWRRLNEECVALHDLEFTAQAFDIMASMKELKSTILP